MTYYVTYRVDARFVAQVEADNVHQARYEAMQRFQDADFGEAQDIDGEDIIVEDENGNFVWER
jgi:hypothetical protein